MKRNIFRLDLKEGRLGASRRGLGREFQVTGPMYEKARFPYLFDEWNSHETSVCRTQRAGRLTTDRLREDQISKQEQMNLCYDSTGWKSCPQSELGLATNAEI